MHPLSLTAATLWLTLLLLSLLHPAPILSLSAPQPSHPLYTPPPTSTPTTDPIRHQNIFAKLYHSYTPFSYGVLDLWSDAPLLLGESFTLYPNHPDDSSWLDPTAHERSFVSSVSRINNLHPYEKFIPRYDNIVSRTTRPCFAYHRSDLQTQHNPILAGFIFASSEGHYFPPGSKEARQEPLHAITVYVTNEVPAGWVIQSLVQVNIQGTTFAEVMSIQNSAFGSRYGIAYSLGGETQRPLVPPSISISGPPHPPLTLTDETDPIPGTLHWRTSLTFDYTPGVYSEETFERVDALTIHFHQVTPNAIIPFRLAFDVANLQRIDRLVFTPYKIVNRIMNTWAFSKELSQKFPPHCTVHSSQPSSPSSPSSPPSPTSPRENNPNMTTGDNNNSHDQTRHPNAAHAQAPPTSPAAAARLFCDTSSNIESFLLITSPVETPTSPLDTIPLIPLVTCTIPLPIFALQRILASELHLDSETALAMKTLDVGRWDGKGIAVYALLEGRYFRHQATDPAAVWQFTHPTMQWGSYTLPRHRFFNRTLTPAALSTGDHFLGGVGTYDDKNDENNTSDDVASKINHDKGRHQPVGRATPSITATASSNVTDDVMADTAPLHSDPDVSPAHWQGTVNLMWNLILLGPYPDIKIAKVHNLQPNTIEPRDLFDPTKHLDVFQYSLSPPDIVRPELIYPITVDVEDPLLGITRGIDQNMYQGYANVTIGFRFEVQNLIPFNVELAVNGRPILLNFLPVPTSKSIAATFNTDTNEFSLGLTIGHLLYFQQDLTVYSALAPPTSTTASLPLKGRTDLIPPPKKAYGPLNSSPSPSSSGPHPNLPQDSAARPSVFSHTITTTPNSPDEPHQLRHAPFTASTHTTSRNLHASPQPTQTHSRHHVATVGDDSAWQGWSFTVEHIWKLRSGPDARHPDAPHPRTCFIRFYEQDGTEFSPSAPYKLTLNNKNVETTRVSGLSHGSYVRVEALSIGLTQSIDLRCTYELNPNIPLSVLVASRIASHWFAPSSRLYDEYTTLSRDPQPDEASLRGQNITQHQHQHQLGDTTPPQSALQLQSPTSVSTSTTPPPNTPSPPSHHDLPALSDPSRTCATFWVYYPQPLTSQADFDLILDTITTMLREATFTDITATPTTIKPSLFSKVTKDMWSSASPFPSAYTRAGNFPSFNMHSFHPLSPSTTTNTPTTATTTDTEPTTTTTTTTPPPQHLSPIYLSHYPDSTALEFNLDVTQAVDPLVFDPGKVTTNVLLAHSLLSKSNVLMIPCELRAPSVEDIKARYYGREYWKDDSQSQQPATRATSTRTHATPPPSSHPTDQLSNISSTPLQQHNDVPDPNPTQLNIPLLSPNPLGAGCVYWDCYDGLLVAPDSHFLPLKDVLTRALIMDNDAIFRRNPTLDQFSMHLFSPPGLPPSSFPTLLIVLTCVFGLAVAALVTFLCIRFKVCSRLLWRYQSRKSRRDRDRALDQLGDDDDSDEDDDDDEYFVDDAQNAQRHRQTARGPGIN